MVYFGCDISSSMFSGDCTISRRRIDFNEMSSQINRGVVSCLNRSHSHMVLAMIIRFGIRVQIPNMQLKATLSPGDSIIVMEVIGLPRLTKRHKKYTEEDVEQAMFSFSRYSVA